MLCTFVLQFEHLVALSASRTLPEGLGYHCPWSNLTATYTLVYLLYQELSLVEANAFEVRLYDASLVEMILDQHVVSSSVLHWLGFEVRLRFVVPF